MLKAVVVGTGLIATQKHLPAWKRLSTAARVVAICESDLKRGESVATQFGIPNVYQGLEQLLEREQPDVVDLCTPPRSHAPLAILSLQGGAHVLVEKPMAMSEQECDTIIAAAAQAGKTVCVAHSDLFYPAFLGLRETVERGDIGRVRGMHIFLSTPVDYITSKEDHWAHRLPGGVLGETGPHVVYMALPFIRSVRSAHVHGRKLLSQFSWSPYEDYRIVLVGDGAVCSATLTYATRQWAARVDVWGDEGIVAADLESQALVTSRRTRLNPAEVAFGAVRDAAEALSSTALAGARHVTRTLPSTHDLLIRRLCEHLDAGKQPPVTAEEGRESIRVMSMLAEELQPTSPPGKAVRA